MITMNRSIVLLPLKLEIRKMVGGSYPLANYGDLPQPQRVDTNVPTLEYWIRWYPDDLAIHVPPKPITPIEKQKLAEFKNYCERQVTYAFDIRNSLGLLTRNFIDQVAQGSKEQADSILEIYNEQKNGQVVKKIDCKDYNRASLEIITQLYEEQKVRKPEDRVVGLRLGWKKYFDFENPCLQWAWRQFVSQVGIVRAKYLVENSDQNITDTTEDGFFSNIVGNQSLIKILMPAQIQLFTLTNGVVAPVTGSIPVQPDLFLTIRSTPESLWLMDFNKAIAKGMGVKVTGDRATQIENASWLVATGFSPDDTEESKSALFQEILAGLKSRGELALTAQDTPTNNTEEVESGTTIDPKGIEEFIKNQFHLSPQENSLPADLLLRPAFDSSNKLSDAERLSSALGIAPEVFNGVAGAELKEQIHAESMALLIWRSCTRVFREHWNLRDDVMWNHLEAFFVKFVKARGPLPILTLRKNPYGVLPIVRLQDWKEHPGNFSPEQLAILHWVHLISKSMKKDFKEILQETPSLSHNQDFNTLLQILRLCSVSHELLYRTIDTKIIEGTSTAFFSADPQQIEGSLVKDDNEKAGLGYLEAISIGKYNGTNMVHLSSTLERPENLQANHSVLHKLLNLYIYTNNSEQEIKKRLEGLKDSSQALLGLGIEKLEILMMEVFDLLSFRLDAWVTALATVRMYETCKASNQLPAIGAYGWLEIARPLRESIEPSEYIQAPSLSQAATAALLYNGALDQRNQGKTFCVNLNSKRVREGSLYLERIRQGSLPGEVLGYRLERLIHQVAKQPNSPLKDGDIYALREIFRLPHCRDSMEDNNTAYSVLIDGKGFVESFEKLLNPQAENLEITPAKVAALGILRDTLQKTIDAATDLASAEMVYQFMQGNTARVSAWMDFLEAEVVPPELEFSRSVRTGKIVETRVYLSISDLEDDEASPFPLVMYDPVLNTLCNQLMPHWDAETVTCNVVRNKRSSEVTLPLVSMNLTPLEFVLGGKKEFLYRLHCLLLSEGNSSDKLSVEIKEERSTSYFRKAESIRALLSKNRTRNPFQDQPPSIFKGNDEIDWNSMATRLKRRLKKLYAKLLDLYQQAPNNLSVDKQRQLAAFGFLQALSFNTISQEKQESLFQEIKKRLKSVENQLSQLTTFTPQEQVANLVDLLSEIIGRPNALFLLPYVIQALDVAPFISNEEIPLRKYAEVREGINEVLDLFTSSPYRPFCHLSEKLNEIFYASADRISEERGVILLLLDEWLEIIPNATETTALAIRSVTPKAEAPNAILIATPSKLDAHSNWTCELLAQTVAETIDLMKIRMVESSQVIGDTILGKYLPLCSPHAETDVFSKVSRELTISNEPFVYHVLEGENGHRQKKKFAKRGE